MEQIKLEYCVNYVIVKALGSVASIRLTYWLDDIQEELYNVLLLNLNIAKIRYPVEQVRQLY